MTISRAVSLLLVVVAGLLVWFTFAIIMPFAISHRPGPQNPSFVWYLIYQGLPLLLLVALILILLLAWTFWRR